MAKKFINAANTCLFLMEPVKCGGFGFSLPAGLCVVGPGICQGPTVDA